MSASLRDALLFVTLALGAAIKRIFIYVTYFLKKFVLPVFMSLIQERLLLKLRLLMKHFPHYEYTFTFEHRYLEMIALLLLYLLKYFYIRDPGPLHVKSQ